MSGARGGRRTPPLSRAQWIGVAILVGAGLLYAAAMVVLAARVVISLEGVQAFVARYPGAAPMPAGAPVGIPSWLGWQHFFNTFLLVLIVRTGLQVRRRQRPRAMWSPRRAGRRRISLERWLHQALNVLWVANGVVFVVLLIATGQWMRIVPTAWEVFPNALSAALQYAALTGPGGDGWVAYNALQQLSYFAVVFLAAPLAIATGVRLSGLWPERWQRPRGILSFDAAARAHVVVMVFFVVFTIVHVALVFATGARRNLDHMYAAQDSDSWAGFGIFAVSLVVIAVGWIAARPRIVIPIARLFGDVRER